MNGRKIALVLVWLVFGALLWAVDYSVTDYTFSVDISDANSYAVLEHLVMDFPTARHGIYREIPVRFGNKRVALVDLEASEPIVRDSVSPDYVTFRLGSEQRLVQGEKPYDISYRYDVGDDGHADYDEFYYNLVGVGWQCPIDRFSFVVRFPHPIEPEWIMSVVRGPYGSTDPLSSYDLAADGMTLSGTARSLAPGEAVTVRIQMPQRYFSSVVPSGNSVMRFSVVAVIVGIVFLFIAYRLFSRYGREDPFVPVVRFEPPEGLSPLEVGYLADGTVDNKDLTSMLFDWADRGLLSISEEEKGSMTFTKLQDIVTDKEHERNLFAAFFAAGDGRTVRLEDLETQRFATAMQRARSAVIAYFKRERSLCDPVAERKRIVIFLLMAVMIVLDAVAATMDYIGGGTTWLLAFGIVCVAIEGIGIHRLSDRWELAGGFSRFIRVALLVLFAVLAYGSCFAILFLVVGRTRSYSLLMAIPITFVPMALMFLGIVTAKRSAYGNRLLEQTVGYRTFISKVEMDKLRLMIDDDPALFYHVLGYAVVLGLETTWAKKFRDIRLDPPSWYYGSNPVVDVMFYSALCRRVHTGVMQHAVYAQAGGGGRGPVHSSFGSVGFGGGGFGGGGGGAW